MFYFFFFFQAEDGIRDGHVTGVQTCALPIFWRWPISSALRERFSSNEIATGFVGSMSRCCEPLSGVVPPHLAAISTNAPTADIVPPSRTTAAGTAIARSVRLPLGNGGSRRVGENSSRRPTP